MIKCKFDSYYAIGKQYNVMVTYKAHDFIMIVRICLLHLIKIILISNNTFGVAIYIHTVGMVYIHPP